MNERSKICYSMCPHPKAFDVTDLRLPKTQTGISAFLSAASENQSFSSSWRYFERTMNLRCHDCHQGGFEKYFTFYEPLPNLKFFGGS